MARKKKSASKSRAGSKAVPARAGTKKTNAPPPSERVVPIPEVSVFSELPFARLGTIGGGKLENPSAASEEVELQKDATRTIAAESSAAKKNASANKVAKGKKKAS